MKFKRIVSFFVSFILVTSISMVGFSQDINSKNETKKKELTAQLDTLSKKYGGKFTINGTSTGSEALNFESIDELDKALSSLKVVSSNSISEDVEPLSKSSAITASIYDDKETICTKDHSILLSGLNIGTIRHKIVVNQTWNSTFNRYVYMAVKSQTSYIYGLNQYGLTWTIDSATNGKIDSNRTLWGRINGHVTLGASIQGFSIGYTFDQTFYDEWY